MVFQCFKFVFQRDVFVLFTNDFKFRQPSTSKKLCIFRKIDQITDHREHLYFLCVCKIQDFKNQF